jgi:hypothetical protein
MNVERRTPNTKSRPGHCKREKAKAASVVDATVPITLGTRMKSVLAR